MKTRRIIRIVIFIILIGLLEIILISNKKIQKNIVTVLETTVSTPINISTSKQSKWEKNKLVVVPAIWKEINWSNRSSWPIWLRQGLDLSNNPSQSYHVHLYQRIDPNSTAPYDWPYCENVHEEAGVYLKFIYDYYHDLPDKILFIQGDGHVHSTDPIAIAQCIRDDVHYASVNYYWNIDRPWSFWPRDSVDNLGLMYKCAVRLLSLFGFNGKAQLNADGIIPKDDNVITAICCAQFYVTKERIHHYTYKQWSSIYRASLKPYCTTELDRETPGRKEIKWFGGSFEHLWHVILGLHATNMPRPIPGTNTDQCHLFRPFCKGSPCSDE